MENIDEEGRKNIEKLKKEHVISENEYDTWRCQRLLEKMYWCHEEMSELLDGKTGDLDYKSMGILIERLEVYLQNKQDML
jgi:hypothetical protein